MREAVDAGREAGEEGGDLDERALEAAAVLMHAAGRTGHVSTEPTTFGVVLDEDGMACVACGHATDRDDNAIMPDGRCAECVIGVRS